MKHWKKVVQSDFGYRIHQSILESEIEKKIESAYTCQHFV